MTRPSPIYGVAVAQHELLLLAATYKMQEVTMEYGLRRGTYLVVRNIQNFRQGTSRRANSCLVAPERRSCLIDLVE